MPACSFLRLDQQTVTGSASNVAFSQVFQLPQLRALHRGVSVLRDNRINLPFPTGGTMASVGLSHSGGVLGGDGNFQRLDLEGHWYAPLAQLGKSGNPMPVVLGLSTRSGLVFGNSPFFDQLFSMGGTQYGIPLRGYDEFSVTPQGYDPLASTRGAAPTAFGKAYFLMTGRWGCACRRCSTDARVLRRGEPVAARGLEPHPVVQGAGIGLDVISPLGPLGLDWAWLRQSRRDGSAGPGLELHFKLGNFF
jgi:outer membrane protein insertion porin family